MKFINLFAFLTILILVSNACLDDSGELADEFNMDAATNAVDPGGAVIRNVTTEINIPVKLTEMSDPALIQSIDVILNFTGVNNSVSDMEVTSISSFPSEVKFTMEELLTQSGLTLEELNAGDTWTYSYAINNSTNSLWKPAGKTRFTFTCPSDLAGMYDAVTSGTSTDPCCTAPVEDLTATVELTEVRTGVYEISDFSGGLYIEWYAAPYGITSTTPGNLEHVCGTVNLIETLDAFGQPVTGQGGTYDDATGVITYDWINVYGDTGTTTLTPK